MFGHFQAIFNWVSKVIRNSLVLNLPNRIKLKLAATQSHAFFPRFIFRTLSSRFLWRAYLFLCSNRLVMITLGLALWHQKWSSSRDNMIIIEWFITEKPFIYMKEIFMYCYQWVVARMSFRAALTWHVTSLTFLNKCGFQTFSLFTVHWLQLRESSRKFWLVIVTISNHSCRHGIRQNVECQLPGFAAFISEELS